MSLLVGYSDSEASEDEAPKRKIETPVAKPTETLPTTNFAVNKANPRRILVRLQDEPIDGDGIAEPPSKRPRVGGGAFSGFNAMLPAPRRNAETKNTTRSADRKVFSLKTGAEPGFSREADAELRNLFAENESIVNGGSGKTSVEDDTIPPASKNSPAALTAPDEPQVKGNTFMFKPLSVARNNKKKKPIHAIMKSSATGTQTAAKPPPTVASDEKPPEPKKVSLFSMGNTNQKHENEVQDVEDEIIEDLGNTYDNNDYDTSYSASTPANPGPQSLDNIASDLNLSKADQRRLFGRKGQSSATAVNVVNFNTDEEYAANEAFRASGEQIQHNPVRAISSGKHSLKQLVSAATGQKEALEESFATGRRNKKEAGSKYGW